MRLNLCVFTSTEIIIVWFGRDKRGVSFEKKHRGKIVNTGYIRTFPVPRANANLQGQKTKKKNKENAVNLNDTFVPG